MIRICLCVYIIRSNSTTRLAFIGDAYTNAEKKQIEKAFKDNNLTSEIRMIMKDCGIKFFNLFEEVNQSSEADITNVPVFKDVYEHQTYESLSQLLAKELEVSIQDLYVWKKNPESVSQHLATTYLQTFIRSNGTIDYNQLQKQLPFALDIHSESKQNEPALFFSNESLRNNETISSTVTEIAKRLFSHVPLTTNYSVMSPFDMESSVYQSKRNITKQDKIPLFLKENEQIFCTTRKHIYDVYNKNPERPSKSAKEVFKYHFPVVSPNASSPSTRKRPITIPSLQSLNSPPSLFHKVSFDKWVSISHYQFGRLRLYSIFKKLCLSKTIPFAYAKDINHTHSEVEYAFYQPYIQVQNKSKALLNKQLISSWIENTQFPSSASVRDFADSNYICLKVLLGQTQSSYYVIGEIIEIDNEHVKLAFKEDSTTLTLTYDILSFLCIDANAPMKEWIKGRKNVKVRGFSMIRIHSKVDNDYLVEYLNGPNTHEYEHIHEDFVFEDPNVDMAVVVNTISEYASLFLSDKGLCMIEYESITKETIETTTLLDERLLYDKCANYIDKTVLTAQERVSTLSSRDILASSEVIESKFTYVVSNIPSVSHLRKSLDTWLKKYNACSISPQVLLNVGTKVRFYKSARDKREGNQRGLKEGTIMAYRDLAYTVHVGNVDKKVPIENIDYSKIESQTLICIPALHVNDTELQRRWILWCLLSGITDSKLIKKTLRDKCMGCEIEEQMIYELVQSFENVLKTRDNATFALLFKEPTLFVKCTEQNGNVRIECVGMENGFEREQMLHIFYNALMNMDNIVNTNTIMETKTETKNEENKITVENITSSSAFDDWSSVDSDDDEDDDDIAEEFKLQLSNLDNKTNIDPQNVNPTQTQTHAQEQAQAQSQEYKPIQADSLVDRIQRLDPYFKKKSNFKGNDYARTCQLSAGAQPLILTKQEYDMVKDRYNSVLKVLREEHINRENKTEGVKHLKQMETNFGLCTKNGKQLLDKTSTLAGKKKNYNDNFVCSALEFRDHIFICPNNRRLFETVASVVPENLKKALEERQFIFDSIYVGLNTKKAPCCFKKKNRRLIEYVNQSQTIVDEIAIYDRYIKEWGAEINSMRFGFLPKSVYTDLDIESGLIGNVTSDSNHDTILRLKIGGGVDGLFHLTNYLNAYLYDEEMMSLSEYKGKLVADILEIFRKKKFILKSTLSQFQTDGLLPIQNLIEYTLSKERKDFKFYRPIFEYILNKHDIRLVFLQIKGGRLVVDCESTIYPRVCKKHCYVLKHVHETGQISYDILAHVKSGRFDFKKIGSISVIFQDSTTIQGKNMYELIQESFKTSCEIDDAIVPPIHADFSDSTITFPTLYQYAHKLPSLHLLKQYYDVFGKVVAVYVKYGDDKGVLPTFPSYIDSTKKAEPLSSPSKVDIMDVNKEIDFLEKMSTLLRISSLRPEITIGNKQHKCNSIQFRNGQVIPVKGRRKKENTHTHVRHVIADKFVDENKLMQKSKGKFIQHRTKFSPLLSWTEVVNRLEEVEEKQNVELGCEGVFHINASNVPNVPNVPNAPNAPNAPKRIGLFKIIQNDDADNSFGIYAVIGNETKFQQEDIPELETEPSFTEDSCINTLMNVWRDSEYSLQCRPYRYVMTKEHYTHVLLENGYRLKLKTPIYCTEKREGEFRSNTIQHVELFHHLFNYKNSEEHRDHFDIVRMWKEKTKREQQERERLQMAWTPEQQHRVFKILYSSAVPQQQYLELQKMGFSDFVCKGLLNDPYFIQDFLHTDQCDNHTLKISGINQALWMVETMMRTQYREYFLNLMNVDEYLYEPNTLQSAQPNPTSPSLSSPMTPTMYRYRLGEVELVRTTSHDACWNNSHTAIHRYRLN